MTHREGFEACYLEGRYAGNGEAFFDEMIAVPLVLIADEAEEIIDNATTGGGDLNLFELGGHRANLSR